MLKRLEKTLLIPAVYVRSVYAVISSAVGVPLFRSDVSLAAELEVVLLNRKNNRSFSLMMWSKRALVELIELGLDQLAIY